MDLFFSSISVLKDTLSGLSQNKNSTIDVKSMKIIKKSRDKNYLKIRVRLGQGKIKSVYYDTINNFIEKSEIHPKKCDVKRQKLYIKLDRKYIHEVNHIIFIIKDYLNNIVVRYVVFKPEILEGFSNKQNEIVNNYSVDSTGGMIKSNLEFRDLDLITVTQEDIERLEDEIGNIEFKARQYRAGKEVSYSENTSTVVMNKPTIIPSILPIYIDTLNDYIKNKFLNTN